MLHPSWRAHEPGPRLPQELARPVHFPAAGAGAGAGVVVAAVHWMQTSGAPSAQTEMVVRVDVQTMP